MKREFLRLSARFGINAQVSRIGCIAVLLALQVMNATAQFEVQAPDETFRLQIMEGPSVLTPVQGMSLGGENTLQVLLPVSGETSVIEGEAIATYEDIYGEGDTFIIPGTSGTISGSLITSVEPVALVSEDPNIIPPIPEANHGHKFSVVHTSGSHTYHLMTRSPVANVTIRVGETDPESLILIKDVVQTFDAGSLNGVAGLIESDEPIYVVHKSNGLLNSRTTPLYPLAKELWGSRNHDIVIAAFHEDTNIFIESEDGAVYDFTLGEAQTGSLRALAPHIDLGHKVRARSNKGIAAYQVSAASSAHYTPMIPRWAVRSTYGLPISVNGIAITCMYKSTDVSIVAPGGQVSESASCNSESGVDPSSIYFDGGGTGVPAGSTISANKPVAAVYHGSSFSSYTTSGVSKTIPVSPIPLQSHVGETESNPFSLEVFSEPGTIIKFSVQGSSGDEVKASWSRGLGTGSLVLRDGINLISVVAERDGVDSDATELTVEYINSTPRLQTGEITEDVVWTPSSTGEPYTVEGTLTVRAGAKLTILDGAKVLYKSGAKLRVEGELDVLGTPINPVHMARTPDEHLIEDLVGLNKWAGIEIVDEGLAIINSVNLSGATNGISFAGGEGVVHASILQGNDSGIVIAASSPEITSNRIEGNHNGIVVLSSANPKITNGNIITENKYGVRMQNTAVASNTVVTLGDYDDIPPFELSAYFNYFDLPNPPESIEGNPKPVINDNAIYANESFDLHSQGYYDAPQVRIDAKNNWWGSIDPADISPKIHDYTDAPHTSPIVDYSYFLDQMAGQVVVGNYLNGPIYEDKELLPNITYTALGDVLVPDGVSVAVKEGVVLEIPYTFKITVEGSLF